MAPTCLDDFDAASPELLKSRALLKRTDTKFTVTRENLERVLSAVSSDYALLFTQGEEGLKTSATYRTLYFDTEELNCFNDHRRGRRLRFKVRMRHYMDRRKTYLEIKRRGRLGTDKLRRSRSFLDESLSAEDWQFIDDATSGRSAGLQPGLRNSFERIMLVGREIPERVTLDIDLGFEQGQMVRGLRNLSIVEVKQAKLRNRSPIMQALRTVGARPASASKYCIGKLLLDPGLRGTRLNRAFRRVQKLEELSSR